MKDINIEKGLKSKIKNQEELIEELKETIKIYAPYMNFD